MERVSATKAEACMSCGLKKLATLPMPGESIVDVWTAYVKATLSDAELGNLELRINRLVASEFKKFERYLAHVDDCMPALGCTCGLADLLKAAEENSRIARTKRGCR